MHTSAQILPVEGYDPEMAENFTDTTYVKLTPSMKKAVLEIAEREDLAASDVVRRAVRLYLSDGDERYVREVKAVYQSDPITEVGRWFSELRLETRRVLFRIAAALEAADPGEDIPAPLRTSLDIPKRRGRPRKGG